MLQSIQDHPQDPDSLNLFQKKKPDLRRFKACVVSQPLPKCHLDVFHSDRFRTDSRTFLGVKLLEH